MEGKGSIFWSGGATYSGDWVDGRREGFGTYTWSNGDSYEGGFRNDGKKEGKGTFFFADGDRFEGIYHHDVREGFGRMEWKRANFIFEGQFSQNEPLDTEASLHPQLREAINHQICTGVITGTSLSFGQFFYQCEFTDYCLVCWNICPHNGRSSSGDVIRKWSDGTFCACINTDCCMRRSTYPIKKQKLVQTM